MRKAVNYRPEALESDVMRAVVDLLNAERIWWMRMNTGAFPLEYETSSGARRHRFFRVGKPGTADILCTPQLYGFPGILWIECKASRGKQSDAQRRFEAEVVSHGHFYLLCRGSDDLLDFLRAHNATTSVFPFSTT